MLNTLDYDASQLRAIERCIELSPDNRIVPITGVAGTGKTSIMRSVYETLIGANSRVVMCAPTGKASKRIKEVTGYDAMTIHRLLEYPRPGDRDPKTGKALQMGYPNRTSKYPLEYDVILADEYAMVNNEVHRNLLDALPNGGCIRMFGDINQLQPIESSKRLNELPSPFATILSKFNGIKLTTIHRQGEGSVIISNGNRIVNGAIPVRDENFVLRLTDDLIDEVVSYIMGLQEHGIDTAGNYAQIIAPTKIGWTGTDAINPLIQSLLQPTGKYFFEPERHQWAKDQGVRFYIDDKVIYTTNNYDLEIFNGESGKIVNISDDAIITVDFGDSVREIPPIQTIESRRGKIDINPHKDLELAYAITTHKAQGSEYQEVCYVMTKSRPFNLNRKNFYTGISRARKKVTVVSDQRALSLSLYKHG